MYIRSYNNINDHGRTGVMSLSEEASGNPQYLSAWIKPTIVSSTSYVSTVGYIIAFKNIHGNWGSIYYRMANSGSDLNSKSGDINACYFDSIWICPVVRIDVSNSIGQWLHLKRDLKADFESENSSLDISSLGKWTDIVAIKVIPAIFADDGPQVGDVGIAEAYFDDIILSESPIS